MADSEPGAGYLLPAEETDEVRRLYEEDLAGDGFVMNLTRVWAHAPALQERMTALLRDSSAAAGLSLRQKGIVVAACAAARQDAYCSLGALGARPDAQYRELAPEPVRAAVAYGRPVAGA